MRSENFLFLAPVIYFILFMFILDHYLKTMDMLSSTNDMFVLYRIYLSKIGINDILSNTRSCHAFIVYCIWRVNQSHKRHFVIILLCDTKDKKYFIICCAIFKNWKIFKSFFYLFILCQQIFL